MEKMLKKIGWLFWVVTLAVGLAFANVQATEAAIRLVDPDQQQVVVAQSRTQSGLETLAPTNASPRLEVLDSGASNRGLEQLSSASNMEVLDAGTLDNSFEVTKIYTSNRTTGKKAAYTLRSYNDYKILLDQLETGTVLIITNPVQVSNINRWTQEVGEKFTKNNKGQVVSFSDVNVLSPKETEIFTKAGLDISKVKCIEIRKEFKNNVIKYDDGKTDFDRGMETLNNVVSTWNLIDNLRH